MWTARDWAAPSCWAAPRTCFWRRTTLRRRARPLPRIPPPRKITKMPVQAAGSGVTRRPVATGRPTAAFPPRRDHLLHRGKARRNRSAEGKGGTEIRQITASPITSSASLKRWSGKAHKHSPPWWWAGSHYAQIYKCVDSVHFIFVPVKFSIVRFSKTGLSILVKEEFCCCKCFNLMFNLYSSLESKWLVFSAFLHIKVHSMPFGLFYTAEIEVEQEHCWLFSSKLTRAKHTTDCFY